jgi:hypothetical protein
MLFGGDIEAGGVLSCLSSLVMNRKDPLAVSGVGKPRMLKTDQLIIIRSPMFSF